MEYRQLNTSMIITKLNAHELSCLLKLNTPLSIEFFDQNTLEFEKSLKLLERKKKGNRIGANCEDFEVYPSGGFYEHSDWYSFIEIKNYIDEILGGFDENKEQRLMQVSMRHDDFITIMPLIEMFDYMTEELVSGLTRMEYKDGLYHLVFNSDSKLPNELFFWNQTKDLFVFDENGPQLLYRTELNSFKDILTS